MIGIYLGAYKANHPKYNIIYQDINGKRDMNGDMKEVNLSNYDFIICTPPCNYWSRANWRRNTSKYALDTKWLLPYMLYKLNSQKKPFIVENVRNDKLFNVYKLFDLPCYIYKIGRHTYWTNINLVINDIEQKPKVDYKNGKKRYLSSQNLPRNKRQGTEEVHQVIERFLEAIYIE